MKKRQKHVEKHRNQSKLQQRPSKNVKNLRKYFKIIKNNKKRSQINQKPIKNYQETSENRHKRLKIA